MRRRLAVGGVIGPIGFIGAWVLAGSRRAVYSPVDDAISRLAAVHASTRLVMTAGFVLFGVGVPVFAVALRAALGGPAWVAASASGVCTLATAAVPLDAGFDTLHGTSAVLGYATLAATPCIAARSLARMGRTSLARVSVVTGSVSAALLAASLIGPAHGLFQRAGLGVADVWLCGMAIALMARRSDAFAVTVGAHLNGPDS